MIEKVILDFLTSKLVYPVYMELPDAKNLPKRFYIVEKTGSGEDNYIFTATFALQSYGESMYETALMNHNLKKIMRSCVELDEIVGCKLSTDYPFNNVSIKKYRYQAIYNITHY